VLDRFTAGLQEVGHEVEVANLYAEGFDPVFRTNDSAFYAEDSVPESVLEEMQIKEKVVQLAGGPLQRMIARRWVKDKSVRQVARLVHSKRPKDVLREQERLARAEGLAFIAPVYWLGFPAILKGWVERVFTYGFAFRLTPEGWRGDIRGRIPLLHHSKALLISTTFFSQADYKAGLKDAMELVIDSWGFRYPGIKSVEHKYFYAVPSVGLEARKHYLEEAQQLGRTF
jgi:NAD(P)H dehydrogenase (quinone)